MPHHNAENASPDDFPTAVLDLPDGGKLAYSATGGDGPGAVFLHGLLSDMEGTKALALHAHCRARNIPFVRFDMTGHGQSSGRFTDGGISRWVMDTCAVIDALTEGPQLVVGSSMGGWVMTRTAMERPDRVAGLLGIAPAPDFTERMMTHDFSAEQRAMIEQGETVVVPCDYGGDDFEFTPAFIADGAQNLLLHGPIPVTCPVRILHGMKDTDVPWQTGQKLLDQVATEDAEITLIKAGDHRLSEPHDIVRLLATFDTLFARIIEKAAA